MGPPVTPVGRRQSSYSSFTPSHPGSAIHHRQFSQSLATPSPVRRPLQLLPKNNSVSSVSSAGGNSSAFATPSTISSSPSSFTSRLFPNNTSQSPVFIRQKTGGGGAYLPSPVLRKLQPRSLMPQPPKVTLDSIVTDYLRKQHAICRNPVVVCPPEPCCLRRPEVSNFGSSSFCLTEFFCHTEIIVYCTFVRFLA